MHPFVSAQVLGLCGLFSALLGISGFLRGKFSFGRRDTIFVLEGAFGYTASALCCVAAIVFTIICIRKVREGLRERPYRIDYP